MNYSRENGWYYNSLNDRAPAWTSVEFLHQFLTDHKNAGPYAEEKPLPLAQKGDIIQLSFDGEKFAHSLLVVEVRRNILIATHTGDSDKRPLNTYPYLKCRLLQLVGVNA